jgi:hypothetical protein
MGVISKKSIAVPEPAPNWLCDKNYYSPIIKEGI